MLEEGYRNFLGVKNVGLFVVFEASKDYVRLIKVEFSSGFGDLLSKSAISLLPATLSRKGFLLFLIKKPCKGIFSLESCHLNLKICVNSLFLDFNKEKVISIYFFPFFVNNQKALVHVA